MSSLDPCAQIELDTAALREELCARWPSSAQLDVALRMNSPCGDEGAMQLRRQGKLLAVYVTHPVPSYRYLTWQFHADGRAIEHLAELLRVLRELGPFEREPDGMCRTTGWGEVELSLSLHALLDGATPAEMLVIDPQRVLQVARTEFGGDV